MKRNEKNLKKKSIDIKLIILIDIILLIAVFFAYKNIYTVETRKTIYAEASEKFVEENKQPVFKIGKIILYSSANAIDNSDGQLKDIDISQFTDLQVYIDNTKKSPEITAENTINEMYIDNIKFSIKSNNGTKSFNYKNPFDFGKFIQLDNYRDDGILFQISNTNEEDALVNYNDNVFFTDCSNPISLGFVNKDLLTGCEVNSTNGSSKRLRYDGRIILHPVSIRKMPFDKNLKLAHSDEIRRIPYYGGQKIPITLIPPQLGSTVIRACYIYRFQISYLIHNLQKRPYLKLPP